MKVLFSISFCMIFLLFGIDEAYAQLCQAGHNWQARHGMTSAKYQQEFTKLGKQGYRLVDISGYSVGGTALYAAIWEKKSGPAWVARHGMTSAKYQQEFTKLGQRGYRLIGTSGYNVGGKTRYAAIWVDDANAESRRLRELIYEAYDNPEFGDEVVRGFLVKQVGGSCLADIAGGLRFQPLSTLKLLPYLYTMIELDKSSATLNGTTVSWIETTKDDPNTPFDDRNYASCLTSGSPDTQTGTAVLADALPTMMWESHNRTLDAVLDKYDPNNITTRAYQLGLTQTEMYFGCLQPNGPSQPWASNRSTLYV